MRLSDTIEGFIKELLSQDEREVELKRSELAQYFNCAPSQINYVLATRFTPDQGYVIESRRGGGGYIRIVRLVQDSTTRLAWLLNERIGDSITAQEAARLIQHLADQKAITAGTGQTMQAAVSEQSLAIPIPQAMKDALRARILKNMLVAAARQQAQEGTDAV